MNGNELFGNELPGNKLPGNESSGNELSGDELLRLEIKKTYPEFQMEVALKVNRGEIFSLVGPSGCGKTTLLRLIAGLEEPDHGTIILDGREITSLPPAQRRVGLVFQDYALFPHLTVAGNIEYGLKVQRLPAPARRQRLTGLLALFGLEGLAHRQIQHLSGGEKQRVALARALAPEPLLLLLDEPFSALDYSLRQRLRQELKRLQLKLGFTAIFVTHQQEEALSFGGRLGVMENGRLVQAGTAEEVYENPATPFVASFLGEANLLPCSVEEKEGRAQVRLEGLEGAESLEKDLKDPGDQDNDCFTLPLPAEFPPGKYLLMLRPEDLAPGQALAGRVTGKIETLEYLGSGYRLEVRCGAVVIRAFLAKKHRDLREGDRISLGFDPRQVRLFPASTPNSGEPSLPVDNPPGI
jgi:ABC-type Fe3+/spermidine/putrescine transport system ATPase subunit